jgi:predicted GH43/DUF377 family glycosyl hydrolase
MPHVRPLYAPELENWIMLAAIETSKGWLTIYHGVRHTASGSIYRLGLALFDLERPDVCLQRGESWMFGARGAV